MSTVFLKDLFLEKAHAEAIVWHGRSYDYAWLNDRIAYWVNRLTSEGIRPGDVTLLQGDFSPNSVAILLALIEKNCICIPLNAERVHERGVPRQPAGQDPSRTDRTFPRWIRDGRSCLWIPHHAEGQRGG